MTAGAAEDVAHEALLRAWRNRAACRQPQHPWPWLGRIVHNEAMRHLGQHLPSDGEPGEADLECRDTRLDDVLDRLSLASTLRTLPPADRTLLHLHYELDLSIASLARVLDVPEGAVRVRLHRARNRLRSDLRAPGAAHSG